MEDLQCASALVSCFWKWDVDSPELWRGPPVLDRGDAWLDEMEGLKSMAVFLGFSEGIGRFRAVGSG